MTRGYTLESEREGPRGNLLRFHVTTQGLLHRFGISTSNRRVEIGMTGLVPWQRSAGHWANTDVASRAFEDGVAFAWSS